ncbi:autophagy-related 2 [Gossypium arboreum]|nr:autophagy-related 2 [Gossypium arboreum]
MTEAKTFGKVSGMLSKASKSCCAKMYDIVDPANSIQGHFVQIEDEQYTLHFHGSEMIDADKPAEEVNFTLTYVGESLEKLTLEMQKSDQRMIPPAHLNPESSNPMGVLGDSLDTEDFLIVPPSESWLDYLISTAVVKGYEVYQRNADVLNKIFQNHAHFADQFQLKDRGFQSNIMNALAEICLKLESNLDKLELTEIDDILVKVKDMEVTGLELSWLRETLENQAEIKRLEEVVRDYNLKLAKLKKKQRLE